MMDKFNKKKIMKNSSLFAFERHCLNNVLFNIKNIILF